MKMNKKKIVVVSLAVSLVAILSLGSLAWFNAKDEITNKFQVATDDEGAPEFSIDVKENATDEQKAAFKKACHTKKVYEEIIGIRGGKTKKATGETVSCDEVNVLYAKEWFFGEFAPELLPKAKEVEQKKSMQDLLDEL